MKTMKKLFALLLALTMVFGLAATAFAAGEYSITVTDENPDVVITGKTFNAYKIFDVKYTEDGKYSYTISDEFAGFTYEGKQGDDFTNPENSLVAYVDSIRDNIDAVNAFATAAKDYAVAQNITPTGSVTATAEANNVIELDEAGYYLVTGEAFDEKNQTVVAACSLDTTNPGMTVKPKVDAPKIDKSIVGADHDKGNATADDIGKVVNFRLDSTVPDMFGYDEYTYIVHDTMSPGLTPVDANGDGLIDVNVTIAGTAYENFDVVKENLGDNCSFHIVFNDMLENIALKGSAVVINYSATINSAALTTDKENNTADLEYSNNPYDNTTNHTPETKVYVFDFDIVIDKYDETNEETKLSGATFVLKNSEGKYYHVDETTKAVTWVTPTSTEHDALLADDTVTKIVTDENGAARFTGLDTGVYNMTEIAAPAGYNKLVGDIQVTISATYKDDGTLQSSTAKVDSTGQLSQTQGIANNSGTELPSTGGMGTTLFYVVGSVLMIGAAVLLVTKKRTNI